MIRWRRLKSGALQSQDASVVKNGENSYFVCVSQVFASEKEAKVWASQVLSGTHKSEAPEARTLLSEIMDLYPYLNCVCGRNKPRVPDSLRDSVRSFLKNKPKLTNNKAV